MSPFLTHLFRNQSVAEDNFFLIAGPCVVESKGLLEEVAGEVKNICAGLGIPYVFKASYRKANRTSANSFAGLGDDTGLSLLSGIARDFQLPVTTDVHSAAECAHAAEHADILQIPAFLCRQTDLLTAAAETGKIINVKKGQFLSGEGMQFAAQKIERSGNHKIMLTERGTTFGYQDLVVDYRNFPIMKRFGYPLIMDCTHSLQQPNQSAGITGGNPELIETIARAAIATGADGLFIETHPDPSRAMSDGANMLPLSKLRPLLERLVRLRQAVVAL